MATVGLDFGTSTTMVATGGETVRLGADRAREWMPSLAGYDDSGALVAGIGAETARTVVRSVKRAITARQELIRVETPNGVRDVRADDLMVAVLREAVRLAGEAGYRLDDPETIRLGCPAMWDGEQRRRLLDIAALAKFPVTFESLIDEPVAAGIAWLSGARISGPERLRVLVFDMGGGTLDIAVLDVQGMRYQDVAVLAAISVPEAGDTLDDAIAEDIEREVGARVDAPSARDELRDAARSAKLQLTTEDDAVLNLSARYFGGAEVWYSRRQLNKAFKAQMDRAEMAVIAALRVARCTEQKPGSAYDIARTPIDDMIGGVDFVVLSGGMAHVPYVRQRLEGLFHIGRTQVVSAYPSADDTSLIQQPELAVAVGLSRADDYGQINMYRPAFDIMLEWDGEDRTVYYAFTPLVEQWQLARGGTDMRYTRNGLDLWLPRKASGRLRVVSRNGAKVRATLGGGNLDGFKVAISEQRFEFSIYPNGRVRLIDAEGSHDGQLSDWHTV